MWPDPGADLLEQVLVDIGADERARIGWELRQRGFLLVWDQVDRSDPMSDVNRALFILERLYPEMPAAHRESIRCQIEADHARGTWHGFQRPRRSTKPSPESRASSTGLRQGPGLAPAGAARALRADESTAQG